MTRDKVLNATTVVMVACALVVALSSVRRAFFPPKVAAFQTPLSEQKDWATYASAGRVLGDTSAGVTIVEFGDYECPFCRKFTRDVESLRASGAKIPVVYRHFPVRSHRFALQATRVSECAARQGRFESMHNLLLQNGDSIGVAPWEWFGKSALVPDSIAFSRCIRSKEPIASLARDTVDGRKLKLRGTPLLLIGKLRVDGAPTIDSLKSFVDRAARSESRH